MPTHDRNGRPWQNFKGASKPAVKGGRWYVRKFQNDPSEYVQRMTKQTSRRRQYPWRAWSNGKAKKWNRWFRTHEQAICWAQAVALVYSQYEWPNYGLINEHQIFVQYQRARQLTLVAPIDKVGS